MKIALAMIVKGVKEEADVLARCLTQTAPHVDGLYLTLTYKTGEKVAEEVENVAKMFGSNISYFEWQNDFAKARNYNFSQVPKEFDYIFWLDADDVPRGLENLKTTIEAHQDIDVFSMFYLYAFDEHNNPSIVHHKTRVIKNDGCVEWAGKLHEDFKENRDITRFHIKNIDVLHLSNESRYEVARERNYEIALQQLAEEPEDARSYWNAGNAALGAGKFDKAMEFLDSFISRSTSDDEKYIARQRRAGVLWGKGELNNALDEARYAIGMKPDYPDAYHLAGKLLFQLSRYDEAQEMFKNGLLRKPPYYKIMVYNPREYDYIPLLNLAQCYYAMQLPQLALIAMEQASKIVPEDKNLRDAVRMLKKEAKVGEEAVKYVKKLRKVLNDKVKLKELLDKVPEKIKYYPEILRIRNTNFIKEKSSGKDLVVFCGYTKEEWTPATIAKKGSGGSEEAIITLTEGLAKKGWIVTVYNNCGTEGGIFNGVFYEPYMSWNPRDKQDVTIVWRNPGMCKYKINSDKVFVDMHDVIPPAEFTQERLENITKVFFKSHWHRNLFPQLPEEKCLVLPNGIHPEQFIAPTVQRDNKLMINTASPVRSLSALIRIMKRVREQVPDAKMKWAYGWITTDGGMEGEQKYPEWKQNILKGLEEAGIEDIGRKTWEQIAKLYQEASLYVYPTGFPEIDCISITKCMAAGCLPITTDYGAIKEKAGHGGEFISFPGNQEKPGQIDFAAESEEIEDEFVEKIVHYLQNPPSDEERAKMSHWAVENYAWENIINKWNELCSA